MAMAETARAAPPAPAQSWSLINTFQAHPALWLLLLFMLILPAFASNFVLIEMFGWAMILGMIALSLMFLGRLRRHGQPGADDRRGLRRLHGGDLRHQRHDRHQPRLAVVGWRAARDCHCGDLRHALRCPLGAHRGHLHDHDHARDCVGVLLLHAAELPDLQRLLRFQRRAYAALPSASTGARRCRSTI